jgi:hypothetical protein
MFKSPPSITGIFKSNIKHIPTKTVIIRPDDTPFMNSSIRKAIRKRNRIHYRAKSTNNPDHWSQYRHLRNDVIRLVREALELFSISNWSFTSCSVINNSGQILSRANSSFRRFGSFSIFAISAKYLLKISHFSEG